MSDKKLCLTILALGIEPRTNTNIKPKLPILVNLGESEYTKIKSNLAPRVGSQENQ